MGRRRQVHRLRAKREKCLTIASNRSLRSLGRAYSAPLMQDVSHTMSYDEFLETLRQSSWTVSNRSFAYRSFHDEWQIAFIRLGGRFQRPGLITFVICVRHLDLRNLDGQISIVEKEPHSYPFKFTLQEIERGELSYKSKLLDYETDDLRNSDDWDCLIIALEDTLPKWLNSLSKRALLEQIVNLGESAYIEKMWREDLADG